jgi:hypothetical protein
LLCALTGGAVPGCFQEAIIDEDIADRIHTVKIQFGHAEDGRACRSRRARFRPPLAALTHRLTHTLTLTHRLAQMSSMRSSRARAAGCR